MSVQVIFDGNRQPTRIHRSYIELDSDSPDRVEGKAKGGVIDRIRIIPRAPEGIPDCGSFEVWFADGRPSTFFYWDDNRGRGSITQKMDQQQAREAARRLARAEFEKLQRNK
jgi:hypothetical protein